jgi:hypothetical protein
LNGHTKKVSGLLSVRFPLAVEASLGAAQTMILGLQGRHSTQTTRLNSDRLRLGHRSQRIMMLSEAIPELASSLGILQDKGKVLY